MAPVLGKPTADLPVRDMENLQTKFGCHSSEDSYGGHAAYDTVQ
jgi:hypothetical protein